MLVEHPGLDLDGEALAIDGVRLYNQALSVEKLKNQTREEAEQASVASLSFEETRNDGWFFLPD
jgi:hypothetical protein